MSIRTFQHAVTGRSMQVRKDSRAERLVEADDNWTEAKGSTKKSPTKPEKEADDGTGDSGGRGGDSGAGSDDGRSRPRKRSARKG